jgi:hypothetical protein
MCSGFRPRRTDDGMAVFLNPNRPRLAGLLAQESKDINMTIRPTTVNVPQM